MAEYIEHTDMIGKQYSKVEVIAFAKRAVEDAPAADVVEVVRCKDCQYFDGDRCEHERHKYQEFAVWAYDNDFCSYGEKRGDSNE